MPHTVTGANKWVQHMFVSQQVCAEKDRKLRPPHMSGSLKDIPSCLSAALAKDLAAGLPRWRNSKMEEPGR
eukprot:2448443-Rhodomonas_salina.1